MFNNWKQEKATAALVEDAQALADKLATAKLHVLDSYAANAHFWTVFYLAEGLNLHDLTQWKPAAVVKFANSTSTKIAALRKKREYDSSDGLAVWLHTARAVTEARVVPAVQGIWRMLSLAGPNVDAMAEDLLQDAGLRLDQSRRVPLGFEVRESPDQS